MDAFQLQISKQQKHCKNQNEGEDEDILSKLPDCVIRYITSFLPTKDAIRTSILSTRWRDLWTSISNIDLDDSDFWDVGKKYTHPKCRTLFLDFVDRVLLLHDTSDIKRFFLRFDVRVKASRVNSWVAAAVKHKLQKLDLCIPVRVGFVLPCCLFTCESLAVLKLEMDCILRVPASIYFPSLKSLQLAELTFLDDNSTQRFFTSCPVLQELALQDCRWENIKRITISIPTLKILTFRKVPNVDRDLLDCKIKIYAANLVLLDYASNLTVECLLYDMFSPLNASVDLCPPRAGREQVAFRAIKLLNCIQNVKSLTITDDTLMSLSFPENFQARLPTFFSLTNLEVDSEICDRVARALMDFLQKSPKLECLGMPEGLKLDIGFNEEEWKFDLVPCCLKSHLKTFNISGFDGKEADIYFLNFLLKNATALERMMIYVLDSLSSETKRRELGNQLQMLLRGSGNCVITLL